MSPDRRCMCMSTTGPYADRRCGQYAAPGSPFCGQFQYTPRGLLASARGWAYLQGTTPRALREEAVSQLLDGHLARGYAVYVAATHLVAPVRAEVPVS